MTTIPTAVSTIISLVIIEGLLSIDNALVLAAMVRHLPGRQRIWALRAGLLGAYIFRGLALCFVSFLIGNSWLKIIGAVYLIYLMIWNLGAADCGESTHSPLTKNNFWQTVIAVELADMTFSIDNIVAAAAFSSNLYCVLLGVFIGIAALRFVAGIFVSLVDRFPLLSKVAYLLVGLVGVELLVEQFTGISINEVQKFVAVMCVIACGLIYDQVPLMRRLFSGPVHWTHERFADAAALLTRAQSFAKNKYCRFIQQAS